MIDVVKYAKDQPFAEKENSYVPTIPKSPNWIRPKALCLRRKPRKVLSPAAVLQPVNQNVKEVNAKHKISLTNSPINPFRKRKRDLDSNSEEDCSLLSRWTNKVSESTTSTFDSFPSPVTPSVMNEDAHLGFGEDGFGLPEKKQATNKLEQKDLPVDWSLKTKIRLTSEKPFPWRSNFKTSEEASGITSFVRCFHHEDKRKRCNLDSSHGAKFYQHCLVWMHPSLPWIKLFPRMNIKPSIKNSVSFQINEAMRETLNANWSNSFRSLYQLLRTCQCPYFYVCAPTFNVLFRSGGVTSILDVHAIITPTTMGLREALRKEGIEFTMPLHKKISDSSTSQEIEGSDKNSKLNFPKSDDYDDDDDDNDDNNTDSDDDVEPGVLLESLGLSQENFPLLSESRECDIEKYKYVDNRPASLVYVNGTETQGLVNFLLNTQFCVEKFGPMAGIPPTLLSPVAFVGATLHSHQIRHGKVLRGEEELNTVEISGPLLPNTVYSLCSLLNSTQEGSFSASLTDYSPTSPYSKLTHTNAGGMPAVFATENLKDCGLPQAFIHQMCSRNELDQGGLTKVNVTTNGLFNWT